MEWSPSNAMKAYLQTLHMCKTNDMEIGHEKNCGIIEKNKELVSKKEGISIEPQGLELISALAAGNQAKLIVQVTTSKQGVTPLTVALAVAAKQTGGKLICILPTHDRGALAHNCGHELDNNVVELRFGDPREQVKDLRKVDFVAIDCGFESKRLIIRSFCEELHLNPKGAMIVANNVVSKEEGVAFVDLVLRGKRGVESFTTIPLGSSGVQVIIRVKSVVGSSNKPQRRRRHKRFLVTFDG